MSKLLRVSWFVALLAAAATPVFAQSAGDAEMRLNQMEDQMRQLVGQVEQLTFAVRQLQNQVAATRQNQGQNQNQGQVQALPATKSAAKTTAAPLLPPAPAPRPSLAKAAVDQTGTAGGVEQIEDVGVPLAVNPTVPQGKPLVISGGLSTQRSAETGDGGFQGQVLVAPGGEQMSVAGQAAPDSMPSADGVQSASAEIDDPQFIYRKANESLANWQYAEAAQGFSDFLQKYPTHNLAGSAQYWLGETFFAQRDYSSAAKNFLAAYQNYPKSRRASDSLLKLGMSLDKMGIKDKACASFSAVSTEFPNAIDVKKRAQVEFRRAGC